MRFPAAALAAAVAAFAATPAIAAERGTLGSLTAQVVEAPAQIDFAGPDVELR